MWVKLFIIGQPDIVNSFNQFKSSFQQDYDVEIADNFAISESAVKKQARSLKSVIKLNKNFHIYLHGDRELIEQGEDKKGKFYKVYYHETGNYLCTRWVTMRCTPYF